MKKIFALYIIVFICIFHSFYILIAKGEEKYNKMLNGKIIYVDAGHGGKDNGAVYEGVVEDEINLNIANYLLEELVGLGAYVLTTRTSDYDLSSIYDKNKKKHDLINRVNYINDSNPDIFISIHLNAYKGNSIRGAQVFYQNNDNSKKLANNVQNKLNNIFLEKERDVKFGDYYLLNKSNPVGVIVECGFLSNENDRNNLRKNSFQIKIAEEISKGVIDYFSN